MQLLQSLNCIHYRKRAAVVKTASQPVFYPTRNCAPLTLSIRSFPFFASQSVFYSTLSCTPFTLSLRSFPFASPATAKRVVLTLLCI